MSVAVRPRWATDLLPAKQGEQAIVGRSGPADDGWTIAGREARVLLLDVEQRATTPRSPLLGLMCWDDGQVLRVCLDVVPVEAHEAGSHAPSAEGAVSHDALQRATAHAQEVGNLRAGQQ